MPDDDDRDPYPPPWYSGRPPRSSPGAIIEVYADTEALDRQCPPPPRGCGADLGEFCRWPDGRERKTPCGPRKTAAPTQPVQLDPENPGGGS